MYAIPAAFSFIKNIIWKSDPSEVHDTHCEQLLQKLIVEEKNKLPLGNINPENYLRDYGKVTQYSSNGGFINRQYFTSEIRKPIGMKQGDVVEYLYNRDDNGQINIIQILSIVEKFDATGIEECRKVHKRIVVTKVAKRQGRDVLGSEPGIKFNLDNVKIEFVPVVGDWLELSVSMYSLDVEDEPAELQVSEVRSLRSLEVKTSTITHYDAAAGIGTIGNTIFFTNSACTTFTPCIGDQVVVDAIESDQGNLTWRAISVVFVGKSVQMRQQNVSKFKNDEYERKDIVVIGDFNFGKMAIGETKRIDIQVTNNTKYCQTLLRSIFCSVLKQSQMRIAEGPMRAHEILPKQSIHFTFECSPSFLGYSEEIFKFHFKNFYIKKVFKVYVENELCENLQERNKISRMDPQQLNIRKHKKSVGRNVVRGIKIARAPAFIKVRMPPFAVPSAMWNVLSDYYESSVKTTNLVENALPILTTQLDFSTYRDKFHTLLYLEEIANIVSLRSFDMDKAYLLSEGEFLTLEVKGLAEGRPSLVLGDCIKVRNPSDDSAPLYEGCIHHIASDKVYAKFSTLFHSSYRGEDVSVFFSTSRTCMVHTHYAVDLAAKHLGQEILFPERILVKEAVLDITDDDVPSHNKKKIHWVNDKLNQVQKAAVINALKHVARPLPYVIFGPPGTGKTVTLVETVLQIWTLIPESRLLIVTPSNSSANLFAERLIDSANITPGSLVRIVAFHLMKTDSIPEKLKPYCATVDISEQNDSHKVQLPANENRMVTKSNIGRHRLTVMTCVAAGRLFHLGFPKGHFTHLIVDEAGQASEPECMIPLSFMDRTCGQIILAGDPQQLGPVVLSTHALQYGLEESYLGRLIKTFPYQRDIDSFKGKCDGYNPMLITKLLYNYRAIPKLLSLPSDLYYNGTLISQVNTNTEWVREIITKVRSEVAASNDGEHPGIMFYGIRGINLKGDDSPSWYNPHEASMLTLFISKLYQNGIAVDDIGVITPYIQQNKFIRATLADLELDVPKVGTVEEFQGQERKIILASTVRSSEMNTFNMRVNNVSPQQIMGFLRNPKRVNVLLTRAQVLLVVFGNPHTLVSHEDWKRVIEYSVHCGSYMGCDLPHNIHLLGRR